MMDFPDFVNQICARHDLTRVAALPTVGSRGVFKVRDGAGVDRVLKFQREENAHELAVLNLWGRAGVAPAAVCLEPRVLLLDHLPGTPLSSLPCGGERQTKAVVRALADVHEIARAAPAAVAEIEVHVLDRQARLERQPEIGMIHKRRAEAALDEALRAGSERRVLHGDLHSSNVLADGDRVWFIDPLGLAGPPAFDVAHFAACLPVRQGEALAATHRAYDGHLPGLDAWFRWIAVYRLDVSLRHSLDDIVARRKLVERAVCASRTVTG